MARPVTLFTGQWADLPLEKLAQKVSEWGFDGLELVVEVGFEVEFHPTAPVAPLAIRMFLSCRS